MRLKTTRPLLLASMVLTMFSAPALALDGADLVKKINGAYEMQGAQIAATTITVNGDTVALSGVSFSPAGDAAQSIALGNIRFEGVTENNGGYRIETAKFDNIDYAEEDVAFSIHDMSLSGLVIPADPTAGGIDALIYYDKAETGPVSLKIGAVETLALSRTVTIMALSDDKDLMSFDFDAEGLKKADLSLVDDPQTKEAIDKLQARTLTGTMTVSGSWELSSGTLNIEDYAIDVDNIGRLSLAFGLSGYTPDFIKAVQETVKAQAANPNKEQADQATSLAMLGLMQQLSFINAEIRFEDAGVTGRAIDYAAAQQRMSGQQMTQMIKAMTPLMMASFNVPELQNAVSAAVNTYLDRPESFTITAEPEKPIPFPMIMGAAMGAPNSLPKMLGVTVNANE